MGLLYGQQHEEGFDATVWTLNIANKYRKISRISKNCSVYVYFDSIGKEFPLRWRRPKYTIPDSFKTDAHIEFDRELRPQFTAHFGKDLVREIFNHTDTKTDIPPGISRECYIITTVSGIDIAFLMIETSVTETRVGDIFVDTYEKQPLILDIPSEHKIQMRFVDDLTDERESYSAKLKIKSHTEIELN